MRRKGWKKDGNGYVRQFSLGIRMAMLSTLTGRWMSSTNVLARASYGSTPEECAEKLERRLCDWLGRQSARLASELEKRER